MEGHAGDKEQDIPKLYKKLSKSDIVQLLETRRKFAFIDKLIKDGQRNEELKRLISELCPMVKKIKAILEIKSPELLEDKGDIWHKLSMSYFGVK